MRSLFLPARRAVRALEATPAQVVATGASLGGGWGADPVDGDSGYKRAGSGNREVPHWTREKARVFSVAAYRYNPMARAIIDTYTSFATGDSGVTYQCSSPEVQRVVDEFWTDPRNRVASIQDVWLRTLLLHGEDLTELLVGELTGVLRFCPYDPGLIADVVSDKGNPLWPSQVRLQDAAGLEGQSFQLVSIDPGTGLRTGQAVFATPFKTLMTDVRGMPFLSPILDDLDAYDTVISNLMDRTALARYMVWDVTVTGDQAKVDEYVNARGGRHIPPSGSVEVHNEAVKWEAKYAQSGAEEDSVAAKTVLTKLAAGAGLAKTWLAEPEDANRATSLTMAEPVRRRVGNVQKLWLDFQTELVRFAVDQAVAAKRIPAMVQAVDAKTKQTFQIPASQSVTVTGPEVAAADAQMTAQMLLNLSTGLQQMVEAKVLSAQAASVAARKAWEQFVGIPYTPDLDSPEADRDDIATEIDAAETSNSRRPPLRAVN